ncbi:hypothetical protein IWW36_001624 [Coemansia brasiliensis]|uniref:S-adenosyl-L-methionine-dependent methyltransferase n=1 Tax=Coemansia brasiliensis TaxID=2650707 RepID=A0A9W8I8Q7_9FUNG|nr:hypothetical protein IWW36_001624 [Coemansia brasiliensis]
MDSTNTPPRNIPQLDPASSRLFSWKHLALGILAVVMGWTFNYLHTHPAESKELQDWVFSKLWSHMSQVNSRRIEEFRKPMWSKVQGKVLEIGVGHGEALMLLPHSGSQGQLQVQGIHSYVAVEPNAFLHPRLAQTAAKAGFAVKYDPETCPDAARASSTASNKDLPELTIVNGTLDQAPAHIPGYIRSHGPYDYAIASMVLCSVDNVRANLHAIQDLLAPGGKFIFIEHVHHTDSSDTTVNSQYTPGSLNLVLWKTVQSVLTPVWKAGTGNCHLNRDTGRLIREMGGWSKVDIQTHRGSDGIIEKLTPLTYGIAVKE